MVSSPSSPVAVSNGKNGNGNGDGGTGGASSTTRTGRGIPSSPSSTTTTPSRLRFTLISFVLLAASLTVLNIQNVSKYKWNEFENVVDSATVPSYSYSSLFDGAVSSLSSPLSFLMNTDNNSGDYDDDIEDEGDQYDEDRDDNVNKIIETTTNQTDQQVSSSNTHEISAQHQSETPQPLQIQELQHQQEINATRHVNSTNTQTIVVSSQSANSSSLHSSQHQASTNRSHSRSYNSSTDSPMVHTDSTTRTKEKIITIGYAVTVTDCNLKGEYVADSMLDNAAVLRHSILRHTNSATATRFMTNVATTMPNVTSKIIRSRYDCKFYAFIHPDASQCAPYMSKLGYHVQIRESPVNLTHIPNPQLQKATNNGCCGIKEMMKLYSYHLEEHPIVVHLDLDTLVLKPLDPLFDLMLYNTIESRQNVKSMWLEDFKTTNTSQGGRHNNSINDNNNIQNPKYYPQSVDMLFVRDYGMVDPPRRRVHQIGVQGGFLIVKPNTTDYDRMIEIILNGGDGYTIGGGWGGNKHQYGGYYGAATVQGLASYYYGRFESNRAVELNRCYYNSMVDDPKDTKISREKNKKPVCRTLQAECEDCRLTSVNEIYTAHFTVCGKVHWCQNPIKWAFPDRQLEHPLCMDLFQQWHLVRYELEELWKMKYSAKSGRLTDAYIPTRETQFTELKWKIQKSKVTKANKDEDQQELNYLQEYLLGHCKKNGMRGYIPMNFPTPIFYNNSVTNVVI